MKRVIVLLVFIVAVMTIGCNKKTGGSGILYRGVVAINMCGNIAIETLGPDYLGEATWSSDLGSREYHHIFTVQNGCQFGTHREGDTISFKIVASQAQNCAQCMMYVPVPATKLPVKVIN